MIAHDGCFAISSMRFVTANYSYCDSIGRGVCRHSYCHASVVFSTNEGFCAAARNAEGPVPVQWHRAAQWRDEWRPNGQEGWCVKCRSGSEGGLKHHGAGILHSVFQALPKNRFGAGVALAAAGADAKLVAQFGHRGDSRVHCLADLTFGYVVANTDNHGWPCLDTVAKGGSACRSFRTSSCGQDQLVHLRQAQPVNPAVVIDLDFSLLPEQVFAFDARRMHCRFCCMVCLAAILFRGLLRGSSHSVVLL